MGKTCIALIGNIQKTQNEICSMIYTQASIFIDDLTIIDFYESKKIKVLVERLGVNCIKAEQWNYDNWLDIYNHYKSILKKYKNVIIFNAPSYVGYRGHYDKKDEEMYVDFLNEFNSKNYKYSMQFDFMKRNIERLLFVKAAIDLELNIIHLCMTPYELDFSKCEKIKYYTRVNTIKKNENDLVGPIYEYALKNTFIQPIPKSQHLFFIASVKDSSEDYLYDVVNEVNKKFGRRITGGRTRVDKTGYRTNPTKGLVCVYDKKDLKGNKIFQSEYYYNLMMSRYTLVNPLYHKDIFNIVRFMEAILLDCVPLILTSVNMQNLKLTYSDFYDIIFKRDIVEELNYIHSRVRNYEVDKIFLQDIRTSKSYNSLLNYDKVKSFYESILK